jgi:hypothetical protein
MSSLRHANGVPVCKIYKSHESTYGDSTKQGPIISFNIIRADGTYVPYTNTVEKLADEKNVFVRSGQLCNPGGIATHLGYEKWHIQRLWSYGRRTGVNEVTETEVYHGRPTGVVRVSLGAMTTMADIETLLTFLKEQFILSNLPDKNPKGQNSLVPLMVMEKPEPISKQLENSSADPEDDILPVRSPMDLSDCRTYDFVPRPYTYTVPKKHVEFSFISPAEHSAPILRAHTLPMRPAAYRTIESPQKNEVKQKLKRLFTQKETALQRSASAQRSTNSSDFVLM